MEHVFYDDPATGRTVCQNCGKTPSRAGKTCAPGGAPKPPPNLSGGE